MSKIVENTNPPRQGSAAFLKQLFRYGIVGVTGFALEYLIFNLIMGLPHEKAVPVFSFKIEIISIAHTVGFLSGAVWTFTLNKLWSFGARSNTAAQGIKYLCLLTFNLIATNALILAAAGFEGMAPHVAKLLVMAMAATWNFFISKYFIYRS